VKGREEEDRVGTAGGFKPLSFALGNLNVFFVLGTFLNLEGE
jgi:hypothetical protein